MTALGLVYDISVWLVPLIIAIVCHEVSHGVVANMLGDSTAADRGRLSFNPIKHVDPIGTVALPLLLAVIHAPMFGWAKPVPVDYRRLRNPRLDMVLVALAGPGINFFLAALTAIVLGFMLGGAAQLPAAGVLRFVTDNLVNFLLINIFLGVFNLLPIPPFDGGHVVKGLLPPALALRYAQYERFGFPLLIVLLLVLPTISPSLDVVRLVVSPIVFAIADFFLGSAGLG